MKQRRGIMAVETGTMTQIAPSRYQVQLISAGVGSSGIYPPEAIEQAVKDKIFHKGLHMYLDHPTQQENAQRKGVRSVRDLVSVLEEDAVWDPVAQAAVAPVRVVNRYKELIGDLWENIGTSIRAICYGAPGEYEGVRGNVVSEFAKALSVDWVSLAGRGGKVLSVLESADASEPLLADGEVWVFPGGRVVDEADDVADLADRLGGVRMPAEEAPANERHVQLSKVVTERWQTIDAYGRTHWTYVRDYDEEARLVWFEIDETLWQQSWALDSFNLPLLAGDRVEVRAVTRYVPVSAPADQANEQKENRMAPEIAQDRLDQLTAAEAENKTLAEQLAAEKVAREKAEAQVAESAKQAQESMIAGKLAGSKLTEEGKARAKELIDAKAAAGPLEESAVVDIVTKEEAYSASLGKSEQPRRVGFGLTATKTPAEEAAKPVTFTNGFGRQITIGE